MNVYPISESIFFFFINLLEISNITHLGVERTLPVCPVVGDFVILVRISYLSLEYGLWRPVDSRGYPDSPLLPSPHSHYSFRPVRVRVR